MVRSTSIALAATTAVAAAAALPALTGAQAPGPRDITLNMKVRGAAQVKHDRSVKGDRLAPGDVLVVRLAAFGADGKAAGSAYTECVNVGRKASSGNATLQCTQTYDLKDGQIVTSGVVRFSQLSKLSVAIVGGSGAYRGASGYLSAGQTADGYDSADVLHLDGPAER